MNHRSASTKTSGKRTQNTELRRAACNISGKLGSLYNAHTDTFVKHHLLLQEPPHYSTNKPPTCTGFWFDEREHTSGSLNTLGIEDELCLSLYLGLCSEKLNGRASLVNYEKSIDQQTIFLLYSSSTREQCLPMDSLHASNLFPNGIFNKLDVDATHVVHKIIWGFEILFIVQVDRSIRGIHSNKDTACFLDKFRDIVVQNASKSIELTQDEQNLWKKLNIQIQTSSPDITFDHPLQISSIIRCIQHFQDSWLQYQHPLIYVFQPVEWFYNKIYVANYRYYEIDSTESKEIQRQLFLVQNALNKLTTSFQSLQETDKEQYLLQQSSHIKRELQRIQQRKDELFQNLRSILIKVRQNRERSHMISEILAERQYDSLQKFTISQITVECDDLYKKALWIKQLRKENFQYLQVPNDESSGKREQISKLFRSSTEPVYILCSSDVFIEQDEKLWNSCRQELIKKKNQDSNVRLIYADLSYCEHTDLKETTIITCNSRTTEPIISLMQEKTEINVLLLGESGVGKSTFINAFVNYLTFDSLEQAAAGQPVVLIPVSFVLALTDKLEEFTVKFGDVDANEVHNHLGQSVTQYCRSYVFDISDTLRLRLIDTPGVGDTRGLDQDQKNIDQILSYINNFSHINAVCILLQPNITRLSIFFRSCVTQLFTYLTPAARDNIIFCFTNTRSTFFAPGNTAPLLKSFLKELPITDIPFSKKNSFCFDSESFRYLAAVKNSVKFDEDQEQECLNSWTASVTESGRLLAFIYQLKPYCISKWQSEKHAKLEVYTMVRPLMETLRTEVFTLILQQQHRNNIFIKLIPKAIEVPSAICYRSSGEITIKWCDILAIIRHPVYVLSKEKHELNQQSTSCSSGVDELVSIDYELNYEALQMTQSINPITIDDIKWWLKLCVQFACFIGSADPFILYFDRFIEEENIFMTLEHTRSNSKFVVNSLVHKELLDIKKAFQKQVNIKSVEKKPDIAEIYQLITTLMAIPDIKSQVTAIKQSQSTILKNEEHYIPKPSRSTGMLYRITEQSHST